MHNQRGKSLLRYATHNGIEVLAPARPTFYDSVGKFKPDILDIALHHSGINIHSIETLPDYGCDHRPVKFKIREKVKRFTNKNFNYKKADWDLFQTLIEDELMAKITTSISSPDLLETESSKFHEVVKSAAQKSIPLKSGQRKTKTLPPEILSEIKHKRYFRRKFYFDRTTENKNAVNRQCKLVSNLIGIHERRTFAADLESQAAEDHGI